MVVGVLDGLGAYELDKNTVRVLGNHELDTQDGYSYEVSNGQGGTFSMTGARASYFDIDKYTKDIIDTGLAYNTIYDAHGIDDQESQNPESRIQDEDLKGGGQLLFLYNERILVNEYAY